MEILRKKFLLLSLIAVLVFTQCGPSQAFVCMKCSNTATECEDTDKGEDLICTDTGANGCSLKQGSTPTLFTRECTANQPEKCEPDHCICKGEKCNFNKAACVAGNGACSPSNFTNPPIITGSPIENSVHQTVSAIGVIGILSVVGAGISSGFWKLH